MSGNPWSKFFWQDWETDPALRLCSLAAQGLWMRMLCIAATHDPIGYVAVAGIGLDETALARLTGGSESEVQSLLGELARNGVFSRDVKGRIYSRRMIRDARKSATARKNGKKGGNPSLSKQRENQCWDNPSVKGLDKPHKPEARNKERKKSIPADAGFAFQGRVVRLTDAHFAMWKKSFPGIDLVATLQARDDWLATEADEKTRKKWFISTSNYLASICNRSAKVEDPYEFISPC